MRVWFWRGGEEESAKIFRRRELFIGYLSQRTGRGYHSELFILPRELSARKLIMVCFIGAKGSQRSGRRRTLAHDHRVLHSETTCTGESKTLTEGHCGPLTLLSYDKLATCAAKILCRILQD